MQTRLVPTDILFFAVDELGERQMEAEPFLPLVLHAPLMALVRFMLSGKGSLDRYWSWYGAKHGGLDDRGKQVHLASWRRRIRWLRYLPFWPIPCVAHLNRDRLVLDSSDIEIAALAKAMDRRWLRVKMPHRVCRAWDERSTTSLERVVRDTRRKGFYNPVLHPRFRRARISRPDSTRLDRIRRLLGSVGPGLLGLDIGCNMGYWCHMLARQGFTMTGIDFDQKHLAVAATLNETYRLSVEFVSCSISEYPVSQHYDFVMLLTVLYHALARDRSEAIRMVEKIDKLTPAVLLWESGDNPDQEINLLRRHSALTTYLPLGETFGTGKSRRLGAFLRPGVPLTETLRANWVAEFGHPQAPNALAGL